MDSGEGLWGLQIHDDECGGGEGRLPGCSVGRVDGGNGVLAWEGGLIGRDDGFTLCEVACYDGGVEIGTTGGDGEGSVYGEGVRPLHGVCGSDLHLS